jgi:long-chain acyl-CoA synthetase
MDSPALSVDETVCGAPFAWAARDPGRELFAVHGAGGWQPVTAAEFADRVSSIAAALVAEGIAPGDRVGIMSAPSLDWLACDFAIWSAGAVTVPVYETSSADQVRREFANAGVVAAFAGDSRIAGLMAQARPPLPRPAVRMDGGRLDVFAAGGRADPAAREETARRRAALTAGSLATIVYTSGSTGEPKGCMISHGNLAAAVRAILGAPGVTDRVLTGDASILFFLPLSHILARVVGLCVLQAGVQAGYLPGPGALARELPAFRPTMLLVVPRVLEKVVASSREQAEAARLGRVFAAAEVTAIAYSRADRPGPVLRLRRAVFDRLVYRRMRAALGGRVAWVISGGAPLGEDTGHLLRGAGIVVMEGWGLTESTGAVTFNPPARQQMGSVGQPLPGCELRTSGDGELQVRGPTIFSGYWGDADTSAAFDDGWLRTGDLARIDADGFLFITGRTKELIVTAGGKNVSPAGLEDRVREHGLIAECVVAGDRRPYITALVTLDPGAFTAWKQQAGKPPVATVSDLRDDPDLRAAVSEAIDRANTLVSQAETIKRFAILPGSFEVGAELTPTLKIRRKYVLDKYGGDIDALYAMPRM